MSGQLDAGQQELPAKYAIAILLARQEALEAELTTIQEQLSRYSETDPDAWMVALDEDFHRIAAKFDAKLRGRA